MGKKKRNQPRGNKAPHQGVTRLADGPATAPLSDVPLQVATLLEAGDRAQALSLLRSLTSVEPEGQARLEGLTRRLIERKDFDTAALVARQLVDLHPDDAKARNGLAVALVMGGWLEEAQSEMEQASRLNPTSAAYMANVAKIMLLRGNSDEAKVWLESIRSLGQDGKPSDFAQLEELCAQAQAQSPQPEPPAAVPAEPAPSPKAISLAPPAEAFRPPVVELASRRLKVLFVQDSPCIRNFKIASALGARGHEVTLAYTQRKLSQMYNLSDETYAASVKVASVQELWDLSRGFDLVHCHNEPDIWSVAALAGPRPVVHDTHDMLSLRHPDNKDVGFVEAVANRGADGRVYVSQYLLEQARLKYGVDAETSIVLHNYVGRQMLPSHMLPKLSARDGQVHLVYEGGITLHPGTHRSYMPLFTQLAGMGLHLHIFPSFADPELERAAQAVPLLHYHAPLSPEKLVTELSQYDYGLVPFVLQAHNRGHLDSALPNKLFEYLAAGLPVIATNLLSLREFILKNQVGFVFDQATDVAQGLGSLGSLQVPQHRFTMENAIGGLEGLYNRLVDVGKRQRSAA